MPDAWSTSRRWVASPREDDGQESRDSDDLDRPTVRDETAKAQRGLRTIHYRRNASAERPFGGARSAHSVGGRRLRNTMKNVLARARDLAAQALVVAILANAVWEWLWRYPLAPVCMGLGLVVGVGNGLRWWRQT